MLTGLFKRQWSGWRMTMPALKKRRQSFRISELKDRGKRLLLWCKKQNRTKQEETV